MPPDPLPPVAQLGQVRMAVVDVAEFEHPLAFAWRPGDEGTYVADQVGMVHRIDPSGAVEPVVNLRDRVTPFEPGTERGLLGIAFGPDDRLYLDFTDRQSDTFVISMAMSGNVADPTSEREVLFIDQPGFGHKGGTLVFDAEGNLYISSGDGAASKGRDAQDPSKLLGAILRIRPNPDAPGYTIPPDNPFVGHPTIRPEKWVYGLRNPWRFSIDDDTGDMWLGDVGDSEREEIDRVPAGGQGANLGWYWFEGTRQRVGGAPADVLPPVWEYTHETGYAVVGGFVYRGSAMPALRGAYVFGDVNGTLWAFGADGVHTLPATFETLVAFGEAPDGELWVAEHYGTVARLMPG